ncbi:hypothetical protein [Sphingomonas sp. Leaf17]|uniref:hypothetical protein n=1 Tax=Sphingomonas sp. Leaf17 TaxID=1735683 RepID=UPI0012E16ACB|nr:hypothetical protein [Sphingomonas sp. Leaf17]
MRLVYDSADIPTYCIRKEKDDRQLSLPFPDPDVVIVMDVADFGVRSFKAALSCLKPKWVFDIRASPRMDRLAGGRIHAFKEFEKIGTQYIDIFGLLNLYNYSSVESNPAFWMHIIENHLSHDGNAHGPYMALLDDELMINSISKYFASSISHVTGRDVALSRLTNDSDIFA